MPRLLLHAGGYALLLAATIVAIPPGASFGADDGAYGGQVFALREGQWALPRPLPVVAEANEGWFNTAITPDGPTPYTASPAYARLLQAAVAVVHGPPVQGPPVLGPPAAEQSARGEAADFALGLRLVPVAGALASACVAWALAAHWSRRAGPLAFWLVALGPVLVNSTTLWAHALSTALGGAALLAAVKLIASSDAEAGTGVAGRRLLLAAALVAAVVAASVVRTEAVLWTVALCATMVWAHRTPAMAATAAATGAAGLAAWVASRQWGESLRADRLPVETSVEALHGSGSWLAARLPAAWQLLLTSLSRQPAQLLSLAAVVLAAWAAIKLRTGDRGSPPVQLLVTVAAGAYLVRIALDPGEVVTGTIAAWPLVMVLVVGAPRSTSPAAPPSPDPGTVLLVPAAILVALVVLTQYSGSGGLQWGGRYLSMCFAPLAAAAAIRGEALVRDHPVPMLGLLAAPAAAGLMASYQLHVGHRSVVEAVTAVPSEVVVTDVPALPRIAWPALPTAFYLADPGSLEPLLVQLAEAGVETVNLHGLEAVDLDGWSGYRLAGVDGDVRHLVRTDLGGGG